MTPSRLVVWLLSIPASSAVLIPPAAVMTPPSVEFLPAVQMVSEYWVNASTRGFGSAAPVTDTRDSYLSFNLCGELYGTVFLAVDVTHEQNVVYSCLGALLQVGLDYRNAKP